MPPGNNFNFAPGSFYEWGHPTGPRDLWNMLGLVSQRGEDSMQDWQNAIDLYQKQPAFDTRKVQRDVDSSFFNSIALSQPITSSLKGMGVGAAEGTAAMSAMLPLMGARASAQRGLYEQKYNADMSRMQGLFQLINQLGNARQQSIGNIMDVRRLMEGGRQFDEQ